MQSSPSAENANEGGEYEPIAGFLPFQKFAVDAIERIDAIHSQELRPEGVKTGFREFDTLTHGLPSGELTIVAGRPKSGRTSFAFRAAAHICDAGSLPVAYYSLGLNGRELATRLICSDAALDIRRISTGALRDQDWPALVGTLTRLNDLPLHVGDLRSLSAEQMCENAKSLAAVQGKLGGVFIDPFPPFSMLDESRDGTEVYRALLSFKLLAEELACPVVVVSPIKIAPELRVTKRPTIPDLWFGREFDAVADNVVLLNRTVLDAAFGEVCDTVELRIERQRIGSEGSVVLGFDASRLSFFDAREQQYLPLLDGSIKQIEYAEAIRERHRASSPVSPNLFQRTSAAWWIENRDAL